MLNVAILMGRLTGTPELKHTPNGIPVVRFSVAVERSFSKGKERVTDFINVVAWRSTAELITKYFEKGQMIAVQGSLQVSKYKDKDGNPRQRVEVTAQQVSFAGDKRSRQASAADEEMDEPYTEDTEEELTY